MYVASWLSLPYNFIQQILDSGSAKVTIRAMCQIMIISLYPTTSECKIVRRKEMTKRCK